MGEISRLRGTPHWDDKKPEWNFWPYCRRLGGSPCSGLRQRWPALNRPRLGFGRTIALASTIAWAIALASAIA